MIVPVNATNRQVFDRLIQCYEAEFSAITAKMPDAEGLYPLDTRLDDTHLGFLLYENSIPVGFNVIAVKGGCRYEVCEFYIIPACRTRRYGYRLMADICDRYPGEWEVKQIAGAERAKDFWRKAIARYTGGAYEEDVYQDPYWGKVTRQRFSNLAALVQPAIPSPPAHAE